jgi:PglZ domain-containing protein
MARADAAQVRAMMSAHVGDAGGHRALALHAEPEWSGPSTIESEGRPVRVVACPGPLAVREALLDRGDGELLVLLTPCTGADLALDVRVHLVKGSVLSLDPYASVLALFDTQVLDPELATLRWMIDDLIELAPAGGWKHPAGGRVLDLDLAWRTWLRNRLHVEEEPADLGDVLKLEGRTEVRRALDEIGAERITALGERWQVTTGSEVAPLVIELLARQPSLDVVALGLVAGALWCEVRPDRLAPLQVLGRARLEPWFGRDVLQSSGAEAWADAARAMVGDLSRRDEALATATALLDEAGVMELAACSDVLPTGFEFRLRALAEALGARDVEQAEVGVSWARDHQQATHPRHRQRVDAAEAALCLVRRRRQPPEQAATTFEAAALAYVGDGAYVDEAVRLLDDGDGLAELAAVYSLLVEEEGAERDQLAAAFAEQLVEWSRAEPVPSQAVVPLENVLSTVVAQVARDAPVLVVVCDGMSLEVSHQLVRGLRTEGWAPASAAGAPPWPVGVALLPTVTEVSRTSLLTGARMVGGRDEERAGFSAHPALHQVSSADRPPVLYHKADLQGPSGTALPDPVRAEVADPDRRVVGVVVNAVDDHLARGDQLRVGWGLTSLRPLGWLLDAAADAGRVIVLTADHGHVLHRGDAVLRPHPGWGERWRITPPPPGSNEIEVTGPRVLLGDGRVVLPIDRRLRYAGHKHGYHGGATPEEVLVPVDVLARRLPEGWDFRPDGAPGWWTGDAESALRPAGSPAPSPERRLPPPATGQTPLFDAEPAVSPADTAVVGSSSRSWVDDLLASPSFAAQRARVRMPRPLADDRVRGYLQAVDDHGGSMPLAALSTRTGEPSDTLRMALALLQRLVNLDGAGILTVGADGTVALDRHLAALQFGVEVP